MHNDDGLGAAMALDSARSQGAKEAVTKTADAARKVAEAIRAGADQVADPHDRTAVLNSALFWDRFADLLAPTPAPQPAKEAEPGRSWRQSSDYDIPGYAGVGLTTLLGGFSGGGGSFGGGGASGGW